jgi:hypothetical protein
MEVVCAMYPGKEVEIEASSNDIKTVFNDE